MQLGKKMESRNKLNTNKIFKWKFKPRMKAKSQVCKLLIVKLILGTV